MVSYYMVENVKTNSGIREFLISNTQDRRVMLEQDLIREIQANKIVLTNYAISSTGSNRLVRLRTNLVIPQEKLFQHYIANILFNNLLIGKYVVQEHIRIALELLDKEKDATSDKFLNRLLDAVNYYISYMAVGRVRILNIVENKAVKINKELQSLVDIQMQIIENASNKVNLNNELADFKLNYKDKFEEYSFLIKLAIKLIQSQPNRREAILILKIFNAIMTGIEYTFVGEQMDKQFCLDLLKKYNDSVQNNANLDLTPLTQAEREVKRTESVQLIVTKFNEFDKKLRDNRKNIITAINNGGANAQRLLEDLEKLDSYNFEYIDRLTANVDTQEYKNLLLMNVVETDKVLRLLTNLFEKNKLKSVLNALGTAIDTGTSLVSSLSEGAITNPKAVTAGVACVGANTVVKYAKTYKESTKILRNLTAYSIDNNLPKDVASVLKKLGNTSIFTYYTVLYLYEKFMYEHITNKYLNRVKPLAVNAYTDNLVAIKKYKVYRDKKFKELGNYNCLMYYNNSYVKALADLFTEDANGIRAELCDSMYTVNLPKNYESLEKAWLPACKLLYEKVNFNEIADVRIENIIFWKIMEDTFVENKSIRSEGFRNDFLNKLMKTLNEHYNTSFIRSKDSAINVLNVIHG